MITRRRLLQAAPALLLPRRAICQSPWRLHGAGSSLFSPDGSRSLSILLGASGIWAIVAFLVMPTAKDPKGQTTDGVDATPTSSWR
jgi:hypothetical protein